MKVRARQKTKKNILQLIIILHSDQFQTKSHIKLIKKYIFYEGEQFPITRALTGVWANFVPTEGGYPPLGDLKKRQARDKR